MGVAVVGAEFGFQLVLGLADPILDLQGDSPNSSAMLAVLRPGMERGTTSLSISSVRTISILGGESVLSFALHGGQAFITSQDLALQCSAVLRRHAGGGFAIMSLPGDLFECLERGFAPSAVEASGMLSALRQKMRWSRPMLTAFMGVGRKMWCGVGKRASGVRAARQGV